MRGLTIRRMALFAGLLALGCVSAAADTQAKITIDRALNSPTLAVKYSGAVAALIELRVNGESFGTRAVNSGKADGETTFTLDLKALKDGDNEVEVRIFDKSGKLLGTETTVVVREAAQGPIFLESPKMGETVKGPVEITVGFGRELRNTYVSFFIDNQFKSMSNFPPYNFVWDTTREENGWHEIEAWVVDDTAATFKTRKIKVFVNNPGGRTNRVNPEVKAPVAKTPASATKPAATSAKVPILPLPKPLEGLASNPVAAKVAESTTLKPMVSAPAAQPAKPQIQALVPAISGILLANPIEAGLEPSSIGLKPTPVPESVASSARLLTPTGKRTVEAKLAEAPKPAVEKPVVAAAPVAVAPAPAPVESASVAVQAAAVGALASNAVVAKIAGSADFKSMATAPSAEPAKGSLMPLQPAMPSRRTNPVAAAPAPKPVAPVAKAAPAVKPVEAPAPSRINVEFGTRIPAKDSYTVMYNGKPLTLDVAARLEEGVPVSPIRHLIEKAGGDIKWQPETRSVEAMADGREIWLKIGEKVARIDKLPVDLEIAPFLESGRTIVPLSFVKQALKVTIEYDKATGHVLITRAE